MKNALYIQFFYNQNLFRRLSLSILLSSLATRSSPRYKNPDASTRNSKQGKNISTGELNRRWRKMPAPFPTCNNMTNKDLFDIGKNMNELEMNEEQFYKDQLSERKFRISEVIYEDHRQEQSFSNIPTRIIETHLHGNMHTRSELYFSSKYQPENSEEMELSVELSESEPEDDSSISNTSLDDIIVTCAPRGLPKPINTSDKGIQAYYPETKIPVIRKCKKTSEEVRNAIATISYRSGISVPKARVALQVACEILYGHKYLLNPPPLPTIPEGAEEPTNKKPRNAQDYTRYKNVLPDVKSVNEYKHKKALYQEIHAANVLINKAQSSKITLHYDTTSRSRIEGEWPCLIINVIDDDPTLCTMVSLRPLLFPFETRDMIASLIVETLKRLSAATQGTYTPKTLFEQIDAFMTDSVAKNLHIEIEIAKTLNSQHIPKHLLCKSHVCEKFDATNISALAQIESKTSLRDKIEKRDPSLKSFLRQKKSIVADVVIPALLKLVSVEGDGRTSSLSQEFSLILEEDGVYKTYSLYKERRFSKLGYTAGALYDCLPQFHKLLERTSRSNLLVRACRLYLESEFVIAGLKALSNFTYYITMPFLNCVERVDQNALCTILPHIFQELQAGNLICDDLKPFYVKWTHIDMEKQKPTTDLDHHLLKKMCEEAATGFELQCAREYWSQNEKTERATALHKLLPTDRTNLPTNNLNAERYLAKFGILASESARHSNKFFKGKRIRDDLMFSNDDNNSQVKITTQTLQKVFKELDMLEISWSLKQKEQAKTKIAESMAKAKRANEQVDILLKKCKDHNGPITSIKELNVFLKSVKTKDMKKFLRQEIQFQKITHKRDSIERPELYKVNGLTIEIFSENLAAILAPDTIIDRDETLLFETTDEIMDIITQENQKVNQIVPHEPLVIVWNTSNSRKEWYIAFYIDENSDGTMRVEHLERLIKMKSNEWQRPKNDDIQDVQPKQILPCSVEGSWDITDSTSIYNVFNIDQISSKFKQLF